jgi:hypothetical protein
VPAFKNQSAAVNDVVADIVLAVLVNVGLLVCGVDVIAGVS